MSDTSTGNASTHNVGTFIRIPLADGSFGYGRILSPPYVAFYDYRTTEPSTDCQVIAAQPLLFTQAVRIRPGNGWTGIGWQPLEGEVAKPVAFFMQDVMDPGKCTVFDTAGTSRPARPDECVGLERASMWDTHHIEGRLLDRFLGRPNAAELSARVRLK